MAKFIFHVSTNRHGSKVEEIIEVPDEELEGMSDKEIEKYVEEYYFYDWLANYTDMGFNRIDAGD